MQALNTEQVMGSPQVVAIWLAQAHVQLCVCLGTGHLAEGSGAVAMVVSTEEVWNWLVADAWMVTVTEEGDVHAWSHKKAWAPDADQADRLECLW